MTLFCVYDYVNGCVTKRRMPDKGGFVYAGVAKLVDALDLGSSAARLRGSSPFIRTIVLVFNEF